MSTTAEIIKLGQQLGFTGVDLQKFVTQEKAEQSEKERCKLEREERHLERQAKKEEQERQIQAKKEEQERQDKKEELDRQERENEKERQVRLELARIATEGERQNGNTNTRRPRDMGLGSRLPKLPVFSPHNGDSFDSFVHRFEMSSRALNYTPDEKFVALSNLLSGEALKVLQTLSESQQNYDCLKDALLKRYMCTEDGYCKKFREAAPVADETTDTFISRIETVFDKWTQLAGVEQGNFHKLRDVIIRDQLYRSFNKDLVTFLKERTPKSITEVRELATKYTTAYPDRSIAKDHSVVANFASKTITNNKGYNDQSTNRESRRDHYDNKRRSLSSGPMLNRWDRVSDNNKREYDNYRRYDDTRFRGAKRGFGQRGSFRRYDNQRGNNWNRQYHQNRDEGRKRNNFANFVQTKVVSSSMMSKSSQRKPNLNFFKGSANGTPCSVLRDTGSDAIGIAKRLLHPNEYTGEVQNCILFDGSQCTLETAYAYIDTPFLTGKVLALVMPNPVADIIIGNVDGVNDTHLIQQLRGSKPDDDGYTSKNVSYSNMMTRQAARKDNSCDVSSDSEIVQIFDKINTHTFREAQQKDDSLQGLRDLAQQKDGYFYKDSLIFRQPKKSQHEPQLVVPNSMRTMVMRFCHDGPISSHMGIAATKKRIGKRFTWPNMMTEIGQYVRSCHICQMNSNKLPKLPIEQADIINKPLDKIAIDIVGPLTMTESKHRYILTAVDTATRWPEAIPLRDIRTTDVAEALFGMFSRLGVPKEILSDNGQQLVSHAMKEVMDMMGVERRLSTPYHAQSNGMVERFNGSLKTMLRKLTSEKPNTWDKLLPAVLFSFRNIPNTSTGYEPFKLMYGREVRGPGDILADLISGNNDQSDEYVFVHNYARQLHSDIKEACEIASNNASKALEKHRENKQTATRFREFVKGDKVLILLPKDGNNLFMKYQGPFVIHAVTRNNNYICKIGDKLRTYHANLLKKYIERTPVPPHDSMMPHMGVGFIKEEFCGEDESQLDFVEVKRKEYPEDVTLNKDLSSDQKQQVKDLLSQYTDTLSDIPGKSNVITHNIRLIDHKPFRIKQYPLPVHATEAIDNEIDSMIATGIISPSNSPYASPITVVTKKDNTIRLCIDFRKLNSVTIFDAEPIPTLDEILSKLKGAKYFTKFDLTKGYWQIPMDDQSKQYTAFQTNRGLMEFNYMPFGLSTAACTFQKVMKKTLGSLPFVESYFDDVLIFSSSFAEHIKHVKQTLDVLKDANLTIKPSKTNIGCKTIDFLGHIISDGCIRPDDNKITKIRDIKQPTTKKEIRRLLGLLNYYRRFVPNFSDIAQPLTDATRKCAPNKVKWNEKCQQSLDKLKLLLTSEPILRVPDLSKPFIVQSDASNTAIGAVLMQDHQGTLLPCYYASRRLLDRETKYAIIEKEALAIVFALHTFSKYLFIKPFFIQSDHKPLTFLKQGQTKNARLSRWALSLQQFVFSLSYLEGKKNIISDALSRP